MAASDFKIVRPITITDAMITSHSVTEADATEWTSGAAFTAGQTCMVTTTANGAATATHGVYTAQGSTTGDDPTTDDGTNWVLTRYTNAWKMFDPEYQTQTVNADTIELDIVLGSGNQANTLTLLNVEAASVRVQQTTTGYDRTITLVRHDVPDWYDWFFELPVRTGEVVFSYIPPAPTETLTVTIDNTGGNAKCGVMVLGKFRILGATQWEASRTINDYSQTSEAVDGSVTLVQGAYSKRLNMEFRIDTGMESEITRILEQYRATELVFIGSEDYSMTIIYGFLGSWAVPISETGRPAYVEIKGLT